MRRDKGKIHKVLIVETKGSGFAEQKNFLHRKNFMESEFLKMNNDKFGYGRFEYLYLPDSETGLELIELISLDCKNKNGAWHSDTELKIDKKGFVILDGKKTKDFWNGRVSSAKKPLRMKIRNIAGDETIVNVF